MKKSGPPNIIFWPEVLQTGSLTHSNKNTRSVQIQITSHTSTKISAVRLVIKTVFLANLILLLLVYFSGEYSKSGSDSKMTCTKMMTYGFEMIND